MTTSETSSATIHREIVQVLRRRGRNPRSPQGKGLPPPANRLPLLVWLAILPLFWVIQGCENQQKIQRGVASGYVLDTLGNRVVGATVSSHRSLSIATTGKDGRFAFTSLDSGSHRLSVERTGFKTASRTINIDFGLVMDGIDFRLEPLPDRLQWVLWDRKTDAVTIDVTCVEAMTCVAVYQGEHLPQIRTAPTALDVDHRFVLSPLRPDIPYSLWIEGTTADGRRYVSASGTFQPRPTRDLPGAPDAPVTVAVKGSREGPKLTWDYAGLEPLRGFRVYRAVNDEALQLWQDEDFVFMAQRFLIDDQAAPGVRTRYALEAVDFDGNVSSRTQEVVIFPGGRLSGDVTWKKSWSPIDLAGDIWVTENRTFTIESGVTVRVQPADESQSGYDPNVCEVIVDGRMLVGATDTAPVRFISASSLPSREDWGGISVRTARGTEGSVFHALEVMNARTGLSLVDAPLAIHGFTARSCAVGFHLQGASGTILFGLSFTECGTGMLAESTLNCSVSQVGVTGGEFGVILRGNRGFTLSSFDLRDLVDTGLQVEDSASPTVRGGVVAAGLLGVRLRGAPGPVQFLTVDAPSAILVDGADRPDLRNCLLVNRRSPGTGIGLTDKWSGRSYPFNNIYGFKAPVDNCDQVGGPILNVDPEFVDGGATLFDYHLKDGSPLRTASDQGGQMGAYGWNE